MLLHVTIVCTPDAGLSSKSARKRFGVYKQVKRYTQPPR